MKQLFSLTKRNIKELIRDPLSLIFCLIFPIFMLVLMQTIFINIDFIPENFQIKNYASGICIFGYGFLSMFVAMQIAIDKNTSFIKRINIAPINKFTYYLSFLFSSLPIAILQTILFFMVSLIFGFSFDVNLFLSIIYLIPSAFLYISLGIMIGVISKNEKMTGPISSIFISVIAIAGGVFMPLTALSGTMYNIINLLPFSHSLLISSELQTIGAGCIYPHILYILAWTIIFLLISYLTKYLKKK